MNPTIEPTMERTRSVLLLDVTPLSLGIGLKNGRTMQIIPRNTVIPTKKSVVIKHDQLDISHHEYVIPIIQGERCYNKDNILLGGLKLKSVDNNSIEIVFEKPINA